MSQHLHRQPAHDRGSSTHGRLLLCRNQDGADVVTDSFTFVRNTTCPNQANFQDKTDAIAQKLAYLTGPQSVLDGVQKTVNIGK